MRLAVFIPTQHVSRYNLLDAMARELADAFGRAGHAVNPAATVEAIGRVHLFFNFPASLPQLLAWAGVQPRTDAPARSALVQFFVDHPLALPEPFMDAMAAVPSYRLLMPCLDDTHLLRVRWPGLRLMHCLHAVPEWSLCEAARVAASQEHPGEREIGVLAAGSIHSRAELVKLREPLPAVLRSACDDVVAFQERHPRASFGQAFELCMPRGVQTREPWRMMQAVWRYTTAALNRARRVGMIRALRGLPVRVIGSEAWREHCAGTIEYAGEASYGELPAWFARARVCLAWGPTQFVHSFSERVLLAMGGGAACVADDRELVRRELADGCALFDAAAPQAGADAAARLLRDGAARAELAVRGRNLVERAHLWRHRLEPMIATALDAMNAGEPGVASPAPGE